MSRQNTIIERSHENAADISNEYSQPFELPMPANYGHACELSQYLAEDKVPIVPIYR